MSHPPGAAQPVGSTPGLTDALEDTDKVQTQPPELGARKDATKQDDEAEE